MKQLLKQDKIDAIIRAYKGKRAVEEVLLNQSGKHGHYYRVLLSDGTIFHVNTATAKLTVTPPAKKVVK